MLLFQKFLRSLDPLSVSRLFWKTRDYQAVSAVCLQKKPGESLWLWPAALLPWLLPGEVCAQACTWPTRTLQPEQLLLLLLKRPLMYKLDRRCLVQFPSCLHPMTLRGLLWWPHDCIYNRTGTCVVEIDECTGHTVSKLFAKCQGNL